MKNLTNSLTQFTNWNSGLFTFLAVTFLTGASLIYSARKKPIKRSSLKKSLKLNYKSVETIPEENSVSECSERSNLFRLANIFEGLKQKDKIETAMMIVSEMEVNKERLLRTLYPNYADEFVENFRNTEEYEKTVFKYLNALEKAVVSSNHTANKKYGFDFDELTGIIEGQDVYQATYKFQKNYLRSISKKATRFVVEEAFKFYYANLIKLEQIYEKLSRNREAKNDKISMIISKRRVVDEMKMRFGLNELELKFHTFEQNLLKSKELCELYEVLHKIKTD